MCGRYHEPGKTSMERPGFNPQALARKPGSQRSGANKEKKQAAQRIRRRLCAGGNGGGNGGARDGHGSIRLLRNRYSTFWRFVQDGGADSERGTCIAGPAAAASKYALERPMLAKCCVVLRLRDPAKEETPAQS